MILVNSISIDWSNKPLRRKIRGAMAFIRSGAGWSAYVLKQDGRLIIFGYSPKNKSGIFQRTISDGFKII